MNAGADERRRARGTTKRADNNAIDLTTRGYVRVITPAYELVALKVLLASAQLVLSRHHSLYEWAAAQRQTHSLQGRAPVYVGTLPHGDAELAVRHVWHGGLFAPLTKDRFRVPTRAAVELRNSLRLRECGIPTSEIVGYALYPAGPGLRRIDVATRFIPCAVDLGSVLVNAASGLPLSNALRAVDSLLAALARHRVVHPDLNVKNILLQHELDDRTAVAAVTALVIDVDVVRFEPSRSAAHVMSANVSRLARSMRKWRTRFDVVVGDDVIAGLGRMAPDTA